MADLDTDTTTSAATVADAAKLSSDEVRKVTTTTVERIEPKPETPTDFPEVQSNHNSASAANPLPLKVLEGKPDYNPIRQEPNRANVHSDVTMSGDQAKALVEEKGGRPTHAEVVINGGTDQAGGEIEPLKPRPAVARTDSEVDKVL